MLGHFLLSQDFSKHSQDPSLKRWDISYYPRTFLNSIWTNRLSVGTLRTVPGLF